VVLLGKTRVMRGKAGQRISKEGIAYRARASEESQEGGPELGSGWNLRESSQHRSGGRV
jgi:hypothetical protein